MAFRAHAHTKDDSFGSTITATMPTIVAGDFLLALLTCDTNGATVTPPTGWTLYTPGADLAAGGGDGQTTRILYKAVASSGDAALSTLTFTVSTYLIAVDIMSFSGRSGTITVSTPTTNNSANASPFACAVTGLTAAASDDLITAVASDNPNSGGTGSWGTFTSSGKTWTIRGQLTGSTTHIATATCDNVSAGATGSVTSTLTTSSGAVAFGGFVIALPVGGPAPTINTQPSSQTVNIGATPTTLSVSATASAGSLSYQWKLNGTDISGETASTYAFPGAAAFADNGNSYSVAVTDSNATVLSSAAVLTVLPDVQYIGASAIAYSATNPAPTYPTLTANDDLILIVGQKPAVANGGTVTTPSGYTLLDSLTGAGGYSTTLGADTGNCNIFVYKKDSVTGSETGTLTITTSGGTNHVAWAIFIQLRATSGAYSRATATTSDTSAGNLSLAFGAIDVQAQDLLIAAFCQPTDVTTPTQFSAEAFSGTGLTTLTAVEIDEPDSTTGNDIGGVLAYATVTAGAGSTAVTFAATAGGTTTNVRGPGVLIRVRKAVAGTAITGVSATGSVGTVTPSRTVPLTGVSATGSAGSVSVSGGPVTVALTGVSATGSVGSVAVGVAMVLAGVLATGSVGSVTPSRTVAITGNAGTGAVGSVVPSRSVPLTGVSATGAVGTVSAPGGGPVTVALTGVAATGAVGSVTASSQIKVVQEAAAESASASSVFVDVPMHEGSTAIITAWSDDVGTSFRPSISDDTPLGALTPSEFSSGTGWYAVFGSRDGYRAGVVRFTATRFQGTGVIGIRVSEVVNVVATETTTSQGKSAPGTGSDGINVALVGPSDTAPRLLYGAVLGLGSGTHAPTTGTGFTKSIIGPTSPALTGVPSVDTEAKRITSTSVQGPTWTAIDGSADYFVFTAVLLEGQAFVALTGVSATGAVGSVTPSRSKGITGVAGTSAVGTVGTSRTVAITGNAATASVGSVAPGISVALTGVAATGAVGSVGVPQPALTGVQATGAAGTVAPSTTLPISGNAAAGAIGSVTPALALVLVGNGATGSVGTTTPSTTTAVTGVTATSAVGTVSPGITVALTGVAATGSVGNVNASAPGTATLTGVAGTGAAGTVAPSTTKGVTGNAATSAIGGVGVNLFVALTGVSATGSVGSVAFGGVTVALSGVAAVASVGTVAPSTTAALTGVSATGAAGSVGVPNGALLSGVSATGAVGTVAPSTSRAVTGNSAAGSAGSVAPGTTVALTGVSAVGSVGSVASGGTSFALAGNAATGAVGSVTPGISVALTGVQATGSVGSVAPLGTPLTGVGATGSVGSVGVSVTVALTGVSAVGSVGSVGAHDDIAEIVGAGPGNTRTKVAMISTRTKVVFIK